MDIARHPSHRRKRVRKQIAIAGALLLAAAAVTIVIARLEPAAPSVDRALVWIDSVKRGQMLRQVRGPGALVPENIAWITARTQGRVERIVLRPGAPVGPESVILILANPDVERAAEDAESHFRAAEAELASLKVKLESDVLAAEASAAQARADSEQARMRAEVDEQLYADGLVPGLDRNLSKVKAEQAAKRNEIEQKRHAFAKDSVAPQLSVKQAEVDRLLALARMRRDEQAALHVRAGMGGVLQILQVEAGAQVQPGANLARVADPAHLKAEIRVPEIQARDIQIGQSAAINTRNGIVQGSVARIDPSVQNGTVTVDISLPGELPRGARPDLSVDGVIELERLENVLYTGRPASVQEEGAAGLFKLDPVDGHAVRVQVRMGRSSVNTVEIIHGLAEGDQVILSDMSRWDAYDRVKLK